MMAGGALGNAIDRLLWGKVVDFIDLHLGGWHWPAFNIADSAIVIGVGCILFGAWRHDLDEHDLDEHDLDKKNNSDE